ncbi:hypothetical protein [Cellulomonas bogoriensis]|uniref:Uncharacterized protein n=1 Tax=Cellulomonas bogoriensis 69B4 = DSM 16987 TaxID=1386082 RepID=A0A0A0BZB6_9CELL|nr:hypothetical protein [Cellulomonas bogoriensis]KGM13241.1 hypothetical protein N869_15385 [Cellulomonas bogoriensis 69B4 = DSM 16987]
MSMAEPFMPRPEREERAAGADLGPGAPPPADGTGVGGENTDGRAEDGIDPLTHEPVLPGPGDD